MKTPDPAVEKIIEMAAMVGAQVALTKLEDEKQKAQQERHDRRLRNTKLLLKHYRMFKLHVAEAICRESQLYENQAYNALEILYGIEDEVEEELYIEAIQRSQTRTRIIVQHIDHMLALYKTYCERVGKEELRRYRIIHAMYIAPNPPEPEDIAEDERINVRTVYKDISAAQKTLSALIFGIDGLKLDR